MTQDHASPLHRMLHQRLLDVFGPPNNTLGRDDHWALKPASKAVCIHVLVNGMPESPAVWVFDPHDRTNPVMRAYVDNEERLEVVIRQIQDRVASASSAPFQTPHDRTT